MRALFLLFSLLTGIAYAADPTPAEMEEAQRFSIAGAEAYRAGDWRGAIRNFQRAEALVPHPTIQVNIGKAYEKIGQGKRAMSYCLRALRARPLPPETRAAAQACVDRLKPKLAAPKITITSTPEGATLRVDGRELGQTPWEGELSKGEHELLLSLAGQRPARRTVELEEGEVYTEDFTFIPVEVGGQLSVTSFPDEARVLLDNELLGITPLRNVFLEARAYDLLVDKPAHLPHRTRIEILDGEHLQLSASLKPIDPPLDPKPGWIMAASGGAALVGSAFFGYAALSARDEADSLARTSGLRQDAARYEGLVDDMRRDQLITDALLVSGGLLLSAGITWLVYAE